GIEIAETDRGGDITYHGPGQLVVYPILDLNLLSLRLHSYMRLLEDVVINLLEHFNIPGERDSSATGVWVRNPHDDQLRKICAMGVRISRWVSMHGLALNVTTNLDHFRMIVPCGLIGRDVTSLERELGPDACPSMQIVRVAMVRAFRSAIEKQLSSHTNRHLVEDGAESAG
ncbi:MAG: lipoyl(octanoyl) transferase LipB, partial [Phycisphaerales bacterium]